MTLDEIIDDVTMPVPEYIEGSDRLPTIRILYWNAIHHSYSGPTGIVEKGGNSLLLPHSTQGQLTTIEVQQLMERCSWDSHRVGEECEPGNFPSFNGYNDYNGFSDYSDFNGYSDYIDFNSFND
ncbi:hypothetical protein C2G38_2178513 [Gigaspora rosea]|uniref:Uncharacterized protein n=1 Tax=Gigaspora rosea TaxID=44941 RepID=A0A397VLH9_9GLOM|nr:hypothetical protein C2G38_2178513 [Gigaspora rosea]